MIKPCKKFSKYQMKTGPLNAQFYLTHPHYSRECGPNEKTNNIIRQYIPKKPRFCFIVKRAHYLCPKLI